MSSVLLHTINLVLLKVSDLELIRLGCYQLSWQAAHAAHSLCWKLCVRVCVCVAFGVNLHYHACGCMLWRHVLLFGVQCLPRRRSQCYLGSARLTQESYKWAARTAIAHVWRYTTFTLMNKAWGNIRLFMQDYAESLSNYLCLYLTPDFYFFLLSLYVDISNYSCIRLPFSIIMALTHGFQIVS